MQGGLVKAGKVGQSIGVSVRAVQVKRLGVEWQYGLWERYGE